jgi:hypothetical protein
VLRALVVALVIALAPSARAREFPVVPKPIILRLTGSFAPDRDAARAHSPDVIGLRVGDDVRWLAIDRVDTVSGDPPLSGRAVLGMLAPLQSTLTAVGASGLRERLASTPMGASLTVEGLVDRGSQTLLLRDVRTDGSPSP